MYPSLYIHVPVCIQKCSYCDFFSVPRGDLPRDFSFGRFVSALKNEISAKLLAYGADAVRSVYIGGGTPSLLPAAAVSGLCGILRPLLARGGNADASPEPEWTVEMNPGDITPALLDAWAEGGANRVSVGIQSFDGRALRAVSRRNTPDENRRALRLLSRSWRGAVSADLIAGLPYQTEGTVLQDVSALMEFAPSHVSLYQLSLEEGTPLFAEAEKARAEGRRFLPQDDEAAELWLAGKSALEDAGFFRYEVSNFARPGFESAHNLTYWHLDSFVGAGPGASGTLVEGDVCRRFDNTADIARWLSFWENPASGLAGGGGATEKACRAGKPDGAVEAGNALGACSALEAGEASRGLPPGAPLEARKIGRRDFALETLMMGMRLADGLDTEKFRLRFGFGVSDIAGNALGKWRERGLLVSGDGRVRLTEEGSLFLNAFLRDCAEEIFSQDSSEYFSG